MKDYLFLHIRALPYFRGFLRAIRSRYYKDFDLPSPILISAVATATLPS